MTSRSGPLRDAARSGHGSGDRAARGFRPHRAIDSVPLLIGVAALTLLAFSSPAAADDIDAGARRIVSLDVQGNRRLSPEAVLAPSGLSRGGTLDASSARLAIEKLFRTGQYANVEILEEPAEGGLRVIVSIEENPIISEVRFDGRKNVKEKDIEEKVTIKAGDVLTGSALSKTRAALSALYAEKGYLLAEIDSDVETNEDGSARVVFRISEGKKVHVTSIEIRGAEHFEPGRVKKTMKTKVDNWHRSGEFKKEVFDEDIGRIESFYHDRGFADARVVSDTVWTAADERDIHIQITVEEGPIYQIGSVEAQGSTLLRPEKIVSASGLVTGRTYSEAEFEEGLSNIYALFAEEGHIYANLSPEKLRRDGKIDVSIVVTDGPPAHVNRVLVAGNTKTKERVIRRELVIFPGDLFRRSAILRSQREIFQLGFFQDIKLKDEPVRGTNDINLTFEVVEKETGEASMGAGFSSQNGATGFVRLGESNLFGNGQRANILWEFGNFTQVEISFTEPWLLGSRTSAGADITSIRRNLDTFYDNRRGGGVRLGRPIPWLDYSRIDWSYRLEEREIEARGGASAAVIAAQGKQLNSSMRVAFTRSSTDRLIHPTIGSVNVLSSELAGGPLGGDVESSKTSSSRAGTSRRCGGSFSGSAGGSASSTASASRPASRFTRGTASAAPARTASAVTATATSFPRGTPWTSEDGAW